MKSCFAHKTSLVQRGNGPPIGQKHVDLTDEIKGNDDECHTHSQQRNHDVIVNERCLVMMSDDDTH